MALPFGTMVSLQIGIDGFMKPKHLENAGRRTPDEQARLDAKLPLNVFMRDSDRDARDKVVQEGLSLSNSACKACNSFKADPAESRC